MANYQKLDDTMVAALVERYTSGESAPAIAGDNRKDNLLVCDRAYHAYLHGEMSRRWAREHLGGYTNRQLG